MANLIMGLASRGSTPIAPSAISGLVAWYDFSDTTKLWKDTGRTSAVTADGDSIAGVTDKSTANNHLQEATAGNRPTYKTGILNGKGASLHDGNDFMITGGVNYAQPNTVIFAGKHGDGLANKHFFDGNGVAGRQIVGTSAGPAWIIYAGTTVTGGVTNTNNNIFAAQFNGASSFLYVNGGATNASGNAGAQPLGNTSEMVLGGGQGAANQLPSGSYVYEVVVYNAALSLANINGVAANLAANWGLTWTTAR